MKRAERLLFLGFLAGAISAGATTFLAAKRFHESFLISCGLGLAIGIFIFIVYVVLMAKTGN